MKKSILIALCSVTLVLTTVAQTPLPLRYEISGTQLFGALGESLASVGDLDGDGFRELVVSATPLGEVLVYSGADGSLLFTLSSTAIFDEFGSSVAGLNDVTGDGVPDLAVGAPLDSLAASGAGRLDVFSGADGSLAWSAFGDFSDDGFGTSCDGIGDLNGDGIDDVLVGAPGTFANGYVRVLSGADGTKLNTFFGPAAGSGMGFAVAAIDDIDGDGLQEVASAAVLADGPLGELEAGRVFVIAGNAQAILLDLSGLAPLDHFGVALDSMGDCDGDGKGDLIVGTLNDARGGPDAGSARIVSGGTGAALADLVGSQPFALFGSAVAGVGDVNGDGIPDAAVGAKLHDGPLADTGLVSVRNGADGSLIEDLDDFTSSSQFGAALTGVGDIDGDGFADFAAARPNASPIAFLEGTVRMLSIGGVRSFTDPTLPAPTLQMEWLPGPANNRTLGSLLVTGASPFDMGVIGVSFAAFPLNYLGLPILLNLDPNLLVINQPFLYQIDGSALFIADLQHPFLGGQRVYVQAFDAQSPYGASNAVELRLFDL